MAQRQISRPDPDILHLPVEFESHCLSGLYPRNESRVGSEQTYISPTVSIHDGQPNT